jgi:hypothetical protein
VLVWTGSHRILLRCVGAYNSVCFRYGDNIRKIWLLSHFEQNRSLPQVLEFFHLIYPHTQQGDSKRLVAIHHRAELASAGYPDGLETSSSSSSSSSEAEEEQESDDDGDEDLVSLDDPQEPGVSAGEEDGVESGTELEVPSSQEEDVNKELVVVPVVISSSGNINNGRVLSARQAAKRVLSQHSEQDENPSDRMADKKKIGETQFESLPLPAVRSSARTKR